MIEKPNDNANGSLWRSAAVLFGAIVAGVLGWMTGVKADIDAHTRDIQKLQLEVHQHGRQLERVEEKIDRLLAKPRP